MKRYAIVGTGSRVVMFTDPLASSFRESTLIVGFCDPSRTRMEYHNRRLATAFGYQSIPCYGVEDFDRMIAETRPDVLVVCSIDSTHHEYILKGLAAGCEIICEKPITIDAGKCRDILGALSGDDRRIRICLNYRWVPGVTRVCELLRQGVIGNVKQVTYEYLLDMFHGADYFRRWHASMACSGGLLVHKSTHHFDLANWWLDSIPEKVTAEGRLVYYGRRNAEARGDGAWAAYERYTGMAPESDPFRMDLTGDPDLRGLYFQTEKEDAYIRDRNVFRDDIDIFDTMSVLVRYRSGATLSYTLNAFSPYEGFRVHLSGDRGRIEYEEIHEVRAPAGCLPGSSSGGIPSPGKRLRLFPHFGEGQELPVQEMAGGHGGGDVLMQEQIFAEHPPADPFHRSAGPRQAIASAIVGIAANSSIASGQPVFVDDLVELAALGTPLHKIW